MPIMTKCTAFECCLIRWWYYWFDWYDDDVVVNFLKADDLYDGTTLFDW